MEALYKEEGKKFQQMIESKGYTLYSFAKKCQYSNARLYQICAGRYDIASVKVYNAIIVARILGFSTVDSMYEALGIDILKDLI